MFIFDKIELKKEYRMGAGIGATIVRHLPAILEREFQYISGILLCASDYLSASEFGFDSEEYKKGTKKLINFYEKLGFARVEGSVMHYVWSSAEE